jgi:channel protein (hemolysin III family)
MTEISAIPGFAEPVASWSHFAGAVLFAWLSARMLKRGWLGPSEGAAEVGRRARMISLGIFCFACLALFSISGVYHLLEKGGTARNVLLRLDYAFIFVLIAGTLTPTHVFMFKGPMRWGPLIVFWSAAITGLVLFSIFGAMPRWFSVTLFVGLGWCGIIAVISGWQRFGASVVEPLLLGGVVYTIGALIQVARQPVIIPGVIGPHELFHLAVIGGALLHWKFIYQFADGQLPAVVSERPTCSEASI